MSWTLNVGGHVESQQDEATVIDKVEEFLSSLGEGVWHSMSTAFHGTGTTDVLRANVQPRDPADVTPNNALVNPGADGTPATPQPTGADTPASDVPSAPETSGADPSGFPTAPVEAPEPDPAATPAPDSPSGPVGGGTI